MIWQRSALADSRAELRNTTYRICQTEWREQVTLQHRAVSMPLFKPVDDTCNISGDYPSFRQVGVQYFPNDAVVVACHWFA